MYCSYHFDDRIVAEDYWPVQALNADFRKVRRPVHFSDYLGHYGVGE